MEKAKKMYSMIRISQDTRNSLDTLLAEYIGLNKKPMNLANFLEKLSKVKATNIPRQVSE